MEKELKFKNCKLQIFEEMLQRSDADHFPLRMRAQFIEDFGAKFEGLRQMINLIN